MKGRLHSAAKGKAAELQVAAKLLAMGLDVFQPLVDVRGIDFLFRRDDGRVDEIQVKSVAEGRWFQVQSPLSREENRKPRRWILCLESDGTTWVFPAKVFFDPRCCNVSPKGQASSYTYDLNLDARRRGNKLANRDLLAKYKDAWHLLER